LTHYESYIRGPFDNYGADVSGLGGVACGALLDSRDLPRSKRTQPIDNGRKNKLVVTYSELNPKIHIIVSCYTQIYTAPDSSK